MRKISLDVVAMAYYEFQSQEQTQFKSDEGTVVSKPKYTEFIPFLVNYSKQHREKMISDRAKKKAMKNITP